MNDRQEAKLSMCQEVAKVCHANEAVYAASYARLDSVLYDRLDKLVTLFKTSARFLCAVRERAKYYRHRQTKP
jgi:hypothetical protein